MVLCGCVCVCVCWNRHSFIENLVVNKLITNTINRTIDEMPILALFRFSNELLRTIFYQFTQDFWYCGGCGVDWTSLEKKKTMICQSKPILKLGKIRAKKVIEVNFV